MLRLNNDTFMLSNPKVSIKIIKYIVIKHVSINSNKKEI